MSKDGTWKLWDVDGMTIFSKHFGHTFGNDHLYAVLIVEKIKLKQSLRFR